MSVPSIVIFTLLAVLALAALIADLRADQRAQDGPEMFSALDSIAWRLFGFFGVGGVPPTLVWAVFLSTAAIAGGTLDAIASMHLGDRYPIWFPAQAAASGMGIGLLCARLLSTSAPTVNQTR